MIHLNLLPPKCTRNLSTIPSLPPCSYMRKNFALFLFLRREESIQPTSCSLIWKEVGGGLPVSNQIRLHTASVSVGLNSKQLRNSSENIVGQFQQQGRISSLPLRHLPFPRNRSLHQRWAKPPLSSLIFGDLQSSQSRGGGGWNSGRRGARQRSSPVLQILRFIACVAFPALTASCYSNE